MPFNQNGFFQRLYSWRKDRDSGIKILAERMDKEMDGIVAAINDIISGNVRWKGIFKSVFGTKNAPAYSFQDDEDTGIYREGVDTLGLSSGGEKTVTLEKEKINVYKPIHLTQSKRTNGFGSAEIAIRINNYNENALQFVDKDNFLNSLNIITEDDLNSLNIITEDDVSVDSNSNLIVKRTETGKIRTSGGLIVDDAYSYTHSIPADHSVGFLNSDEENPESIYASKQQVIDWVSDSAATANTIAKRTVSGDIITRRVYMSDTKHSGAESQLKVVLQRLPNNFLGTLTKDQFINWIDVAKKSDIPNYGGNTRYQYLPGGKILQWGTPNIATPQRFRDVGAVNTSTYFYNFPIAFPRACFSVVVTEAGVIRNPISISEHSRTRFRVTGGIYSFIAIGH